MDPARVYDQAVRLLARRAHGVRELERKLKAKGAPAGAVAATVERCLQLGYLDDAAFAASRARERLFNSRQGPERVRAELRALGIEETVAEAGLAAALAEVDQAGTDLATLAAEALRRHFGPVAPPGGADQRDPDRREWDRRELKRRHDFLRRRGFDGETVWRVLNGLDEG